MIKDFLNKIIQGDSLEVVKTIPHESIDLVITSVPYNIQKPYESYHDNKEYSEYLKWLACLFKDIYKTMKKGSRLCLNIGDSDNGRIPIHSDISHFMTKELGYLHMTTIIWNKENSTSRMSWGSFRSPSSPSFPTPFEYILIFAKDTYALQTKGHTDLTNEEFIEWSSAMWTFPPETRISKKTHPAPFPEELPRRCIKMLSWKGAVVLDPFLGTGTTARVCKKLERNFIGIELNPRYCDLSRKRTSNVIIDDTLFDEELDV